MKTLSAPPAYVLDDPRSLFEQLLDAGDAEGIDRLLAAETRRLNMMDSEDVNPWEAAR